MPIKIYAFIILCEPSQAIWGDSTVFGMIGCKYQLLSLCIYKLMPVDRCRIFQQIFYIGCQSSKRSEFIQVCRFNNLSAGIKLIWFCQISKCFFKKWLQVLSSLHIRKIIKERDTWCSGSHAQW